MDLDEDIKKRYDLRRTADREAAQTSQLLRDEKRAHDKGFKLAGWVGSIWLLCILISVEELIFDETPEVWEGLPYSDIAWWGWLLFIIFSLFGIASLKELFTTYLQDTINRIVVFICLILGIFGIVYFW